LSTPVERLCEHLDNVEFFEQKERFQIKDKEQAAWAMRKLYKLEAEKAEVQRIAQAEIDRIKEWENGEVEQIEKQAEFFRGLLEEYHRKVIAENPKQKTIKLPHGKLKIRAQQPAWKYDNEELLKWLKQNRPELVKRKVIESPDKVSLKKIATIVNGRAVTFDSGENIPGVEIEEREAKFSVEVDLNG